MRGTASRSIMTINAPKIECHNQLFEFPSKSANFTASPFSGMSNQISRAPFDGSCGLSNVNLVA